MPDRRLPSRGWVRWAKPVAIGLAVLFAMGAVLMAVTVFWGFERLDLLAIDYRMLVEFGHRQADAGSIYAPYQLEGPYRYDMGAGRTDTSIMPALYPPIAGPVFWTLTFLPGVLWWAVPVGGLAFAVWGAKAWTWPLLPLAGWFPHTPSVFVVGGSTMWVAAGLALGIRFGWPVLVVVFKPTLAPFALAGARHRSTWIGLAILMGLSILLLPEWLRYATVLLNLESPGLFYSIGDMPLVLAAIVTAWSARLRRSEADGPLLD
jgi:hypothetical protein